MVSNRQKRSVGFWSYTSENHFKGFCVEITMLFFFNILCITFWTNWYFTRFHEISLFSTPTRLFNCLKIITLISLYITLTSIDDLKYITLCISIKKVVINIKKTWNLCVISRKYREYHGKKNYCIFNLKVLWIFHQTLSTSEEKHLTFI